jgi:hypothetical protein
MKKHVLTIGCILIAFVVVSQENSNEYTALIAKGRTFYSAKDYKNAAYSFSAAVNLPGSRVPLIDWHRAAWSQALANNADSAFYYLNIIANKRGLTFSDYVFITGDEDYTPIHSDKRWNSIEDKIFNSARRNFHSIPKPTVVERYNAAFAWIMHKNVDSAYYQFQLIADSKDLTFGDVNAIVHNEIILPLQKNKQWKNCMNNLYSALYKKYFPPSAFGNSPTFKKILIDEGHYNLHTINGTYKVLAGTLKKAGFEVSAHTGEFNIESLTNSDVLIIANPFSDVKDSLIARANRAGQPYRWSDAATQSAFTEAEVNVLRNWVQSGGALFLILDHAPHGKTGGPLAEAFGFECRNVATYDRISRDPEVDTTEAATILFTRNNGLIGKHPILNGVDSVTTYTGESLLGPPQSTVLLSLPPTATDMDWEATTRKTGTARLKVVPKLLLLNTEKVVLLS